MKRFKTMLTARLKRDSLYCTPGYWDEKAACYNGYSISMWPNNHLNAYYHQEQMKNVRRILPAVKGKNVLDVGCGTGRLSCFLADNGAKVLGIDFSEKTIAIAKSLLASDNPKYLVQSVFDLNENETFDIVVSLASLTVACRNREELSLAMNNIFKALIHGGEALIMEPVHKGFLHRVLNMDVHELTKVMEETGFLVREVRHLHFWPSRIVLAFLNWPGFITSSGYLLGEWILNLTGHKAFGDYHSIYASKL